MALKRPAWGFILCAKCHEPEAGPPGAMCRCSQPDYLRLVVREKRDGSLVAAIRKVAA